MKILMVEDDLLMQDSLKKLLDLREDEVMVVSDGEAAMKILAKDDYDLLITDLLMPNMTGHALIRYARKNCPDLKIIAMTGYLDEISKLAKDKFKPDHFLQKPFKISELNDLIDLISS